MKLAYSIAEACGLLGVGRTTLYSLIKSGDIETFKIGRRRVITDEALRAWLASMRCKTE